MAKMKATDFKEMIRSLVREEIRSVVSQTINEVLSERYLKEVAKRVVESNMRPATPNLSIMGDEDPEEFDETPEPLANTTQGIYKKPTANGKVPASSVPSIFFEGTRPLTEIEEKAGAIDIPDEGNELTQRWAKLAEATDRAAAMKAPMTVDATPEAAERRLRAYREQLEKKVQ